MRRAAVIALLACAMTTDAAAVDLSLGVLAGAQLLEQKTTEVSHGPLTDEITLGRTVLGGLFLDLAAGEGHHLTFEGAIGPYHNDVERVCYYDEHAPCSSLQPIIATSYAIHYGIHYSFVFKEAGASPFFGLGIGGKAYSYDEDLGGDSSFAFQGSLGLEFPGRTPWRLEARCVLVPHNPYLQPHVPTFLDNARQVELQVRVSVRIPLTR